MSEEYKYEAHNFSLRVGGKQWCVKCGLVGLRNDFTDWAVRTGCNYKDHSSYANKRYSTSPLRGVPGF
jgi:hypothetical protein